MGLTPIQFYNVTPREFHLMVQGFRNRRIDQYKQNRNLMFIMAKLWSSKPPSKPQDLWELPGDVVEEHSEDEIAKLFEALKEKNG